MLVERSILRVLASTVDDLHGVTMSLLKSVLFKHSCMYTKCSGVAAYHVVCIGLCLWSVRFCVFLLVLWTTSTVLARTTQF